MRIIWRTKRKRTSRTKEKERSSLESSHLVRSSTSRFFSCRSSLLEAALTNCTGRFYCSTSGRSDLNNFEDLTIWPEEQKKNDRLVAQWTFSLIDVVSSWILSSLGRKVGTIRRIDTNFEWVKIDLFRTRSADSCLNNNSFLGAWSLLAQIPHEIQLNFRRVNRIAETIVNQPNVESWSTFVLLNGKIRRFIV